jgi:type II secretory pathway pseudopilin PulG
MGRKAAFTLIELLVVISTIALLMAILIPALARARKQATTMICQSRLRQWSMALAAYTQDHQGRFPATMGGVDGVWLLRGAFLSGKDANEPQDSFHHFRTRDIACCPLATEPSGTGKTSFGAGGTTAFGSRYDVRGSHGSAFTAWEIVTPGPPFQGSYGFNPLLFRGFHQSFLDATLVRAGWIDLDVLSLRGRAGIPVLLDARMPWSGPFFRADERPPMRPESGGSGIGTFCMNRHETFVSGLFLDWSVRKVGLKELWTLKWSGDFDRAGPWTKAGGVKPEDWPPWMREFRDY